MERMLIPVGSAISSANPIPIVIAVTVGQGILGLLGGLLLLWMGLQLVLLRLVLCGQVMQHISRVLELGWWRQSSYVLPGLLRSCNRILVGLARVWIHDDEEERKEG